MDRQWRVRCERDLCGHARDSLDFLHAVDHRVPRDVFLWRDVLFLALAEVDAADELADDDDVDALRDGLLQRGVDDERVGGKVRRTDVGVHAQGLAEGKQASFWADFAVHAPLWTADGAYMVVVSGQCRYQSSGLAFPYPSIWHLLLCTLAKWKLAALHLSHRSHTLQRGAFPA